MVEPESREGRGSLPKPASPKEGKRAVRLRVLGRAVSVAASPGGSLAAVMARVVREIPVGTLDIGSEGFRVRPALSGGLLLEVPVPDSAGKADKLADLFCQTFPREELRMGRPVKRAELRVKGLLTPVTEDRGCCGVRGLLPS